MTRVVLVAGLPRGTTPVQAAGGAVQPADAETDSGLPGRRHQPDQEGDGADQPTVQQPQLQVSQTSDYRELDVRITAKYDFTDQEFTS